MMMRIYIMGATPTPFALAAPQQPQYRFIPVFARDLYNFSYWSVSQGPPWQNPPVQIPCMGQGAAGAIPPTMFPWVIGCEVIAPCGPPPPVYGVNSGAPAYAPSCP